MERHALQRRIVRLESLLKVPKDQRHIFAEQLNKAKPAEIEGEMLGERTTGKHSIWRSTVPSEIDGIEAGEVGVEELSLEHYRKDGWKGCARVLPIYMPALIAVYRIHSENSILTTLVRKCSQHRFEPTDG